MYPRRIPGFSSHEMQLCNDQIYNQVHWKSSTRSSILSAKHQDFIINTDKSLMHGKIVKTYCDRHVPLKSEVQQSGQE